MQCKKACHFSFLSLRVARLTDGLTAGLCLGPADDDTVGAGPNLAITESLDVHRQLSESSYMGAILHIDAETQM